MGCNHSNPWKKTAEDIVGAYQWDERECGCGTNEFKLVEEPKADGASTPPPEFSSVKDIIEPKLPDAVEYIMDYATRGCCCDSLNFEPAIEALHKEWCPEINEKISTFGYVVDAFTWKEWQYNGQSSREASFLVLRIREVGVDMAKEE